MRLRRRLPDPRLQRGATVVEYTLLAAVFAVGTLAGVSTLQEGAERTTESTAARISSRTIPTVDPADPEGNGPSPTVTTSTTTTTTTPPTTTTTTTTTPPTTTSTTAPTTTTAPPAATKLVAAWGSASTSTTRSRWKMTADLTITDDLGARVSGASVTVGIEYEDGRRWRDAPDLSATTNSTGELTFDSGWYRDRDADGLRFTVKSVTKSGMTYISGPARVSRNQPR